MFLWHEQYVCNGADYCALPVYIYHAIAIQPIKMQESYCVCLSVSCPTFPSCTGFLSTYHITLCIFRSMVYKKTMLSFLVMCHGMSCFSLVCSWCEFPWCVTGKSWVTSMNKNRKIYYLSERKREWLCFWVVQNEIYMLVRIKSLSIITSSWLLFGLWINKLVDWKGFFYQNSESFSLCLVQWLIAFQHSASVQAQEIHQMVTV